MITARQIIAMEYGSAEQMKAADLYWRQFNIFESRHPYFYTGVGETFIVDIRRALLLVDVFYQANRRNNNPAN